MRLVSSSVFVCTLLNTLVVVDEVVFWDTTAAALVVAPAKLKLTVALAAIESVGAKAIIHAMQKANALVVRLRGVLELSFMLSS